jgi:hypothetical protein
MSSSNAALTNRFILLVLCLNLVCLVLLVVRSYQNAGRDRAQGLSSPETAVEQGEAPDIVKSEEQTKPSVLRRPSPRPVAAAATPQPPSSQKPFAVESISAPADSPVVEPAPNLAPAPLVNLPSRSALGVSRVRAGDHGPLAELSGRVVLRGTPPPEIPIAMEPLCNSLHPSGSVVTTRHYVVGSQGALANVLVWLKNATPNPAFAGSEMPVLDQAGCMFQPYVLGVVTGQPFRIRNSDPTLHNLHATPRQNREFNVAQPAGVALTPFSFRNPELAIRIKCDVHPWMFAYVHVLEHPYFAITDTNGVFRIPIGFPAGRYVVGASHLKAGAVEREIQLHGGEQRELDFELAVPPRAQAQAR